MSKFFKIFIIIFILSCSYLLYNFKISPLLQSNLRYNDSIVSNEKYDKDVESKNIDNLNDDLDNNSVVEPSINNDNESSNNTTSENLEVSFNDIEDDSTNLNKKSNQPNNNHDVLVSSSIKNALVSLDKDTKEINIKILDDTSSVPSYDNYINISDENINYLSQNSDKLLKEFKESGLWDKYVLAKNLLKTYDTDLSEGDLISIGLSYLK